MIFDNAKYFITYEYSDDLVFEVGAILIDYCQLKVFDTKEAAEEYIEKELKKDLKYKNAVFSVEETLTDYWDEE